MGYLIYFLPFTSLCAFVPRAVPEFSSLGFLDSSCVVNPFSPSVTHRLSSRLQFTMPIYKAYRNSTLGHTLQESLDELIAAGKINQVVANKVLMTYDRSVNTALGNRVKSRVTFKAGKLETYRFFDNIWTLLLKDVEFREIHELAKVDRLKIIACDGRGIAGAAAAAGASSAAGPAAITLPEEEDEADLAEVEALV